MSAWYRKVSHDISALPDCIDFFESELLNAKKSLNLKDGRTLEKHAAEMPGITEERFTQLQEIEAILEFLNKSLEKKRSIKFKEYLEFYNRALSSRDAEKYVDGDLEIYNYALLINEISLIRNKFLGLIKAIEQKGWMISHIVKLRTAGMEDATVS